MQLSPKTKKMECFVEQVETRACQDSLLLCSDEAAVKMFMAAHPELSIPFNAIVSSHIETYLANIPFLRGLKSSKLSVLATMCRYEALDANCTVFEENSTGDKLYIVLSGKSTVLAPQWVGNATVLQQSLEWGIQLERKDSDIIVADLKSGDYFGETALFVNINRTSTIRTSEKSLFVTVGKKTFENFCAVCPEIKEKMHGVMTERLVSNLASLEIPFLDGIPPASMQMLTHHVTVHDTQKNEVIFREGDVGDRFYIIVHGEVKVEKEQGKEEVKQDCKSVRRLGVLVAGNYFGEMALVGDSPRSATVTSTRNSILLSVDKASFTAIFGKNQNSLAEFTLRFFRGSSELRHFVSHSLGMSIFRIFLRKSIAEENLDFWIAANEFKKSSQEKESSERKEDGMKWAKEIVSVYVKDSSDHQVNLPCSLQKSIEESAFHYDLFTNAADEIYQLMVRDNYARFKRTPEYFEFFKCLGILLENE